MASDFLQWPFFDPAHRELVELLRNWAQHRLPRPTETEDAASLDNACRELVRDLGAAGWTRHCVPAETRGAPVFDVRCVGLIRETLAWHDGLADFAFAMQGLGSVPISLAGA